MEFPYRAMRQLTETVVEEVNDKLRERDERLDRLEALVDVGAKYRHIREHVLHNLAYEYLFTRDETLIDQFAEDNQITVVEVKALMDDYLQSGR